MGLEMTTNQLMRLVGPAAGGLLMASSGITGVFALGALLYGSGAVLLVGSSASAPSSPSGRAVLTELREGFAFVRREPLVAGIVVSTALFNLWYLPYLSLAPLVAEQTMRLGPTAIGLLMGAEGIGAVAGSLWVATIARPEWFRLCYSAGAAAIALGVLILAVTAEPVTSFVALVLGGFGIAGFSTMQMTLVLAATPRAMRVRAMGVVMVAIGSSPLGFLLGGALAEWLGPRLALGLMSGSGLLTMLLCMAIWPELRRLKPVEMREG
jgi:predicted MFS family arabinose efflux permease